jgi:hypothetical protein
LKIIQQNGCILLEQNGVVNVLDAHIYIEITTIATAIKGSVTWSNSPYMFTSLEISSRWNLLLMRNAVEFWSVVGL